MSDKKFTLFVVLMTLLGFVVGYFGSKDFKWNVSSTAAVGQPLGKPAANKK